MAGLLNAGAPGTGSAQPLGGQLGGASGQAGAEPMQDGGTGEEPNVTPEEQAQYDMFVTNAMNMMYDEKISKSILKSLSTGTSPADGLGRTLSMVVMRVEDAAKKKGVTFDGDVMMHAATEILEQLVEMGEAAGIKDYAPEDMEAALYLGFDAYRTARQEEGTLPVDEISKDFSELMAAERSGQMDSVAPGVSEYAQKVKIPENMASGQAQGAQ